MAEIYLDHAATTGLRPEALEVMTRAIADTGNAASLHSAGRRVRQRVEESREQLAQLLGADPIEVVFTSGGTEADNLAVKGIHRARAKTDADLTTVATSPAEHHAVLDSVRWLASDEGAQIAWIEPNGDGAIDPEAVRQALIAQPVSVLSLMWANNELGVISPIDEIAAVAAQFGVPMHTDAVQAVGSVPVDFGSAGVDALSLSAHKFGGPQGIGALLIRRTTKAVPVLHGGGQERDLRSGTVNIAGVAGMAAALSAAEAERAMQSDRLCMLRTQLVGALCSVIPDLQVNGQPLSDPSRTLPGLLSISVPGCDGDAMLMLLDELDIRVSTGAACTSGVPEPSHVVLATYDDADRARSTLRISMGRGTTRKEIDCLVSAFGQVVQRARAASGRWPASSKLQRL